MRKRDFIKISALGVGGVALSPLLSCSSENKKEEKTVDPIAEAEPLVFTLPALGYSYSALVPSIDAMTMEIHHQKHHGAYVSKLNTALETNTFKAKSLEELLSGLTDDEGTTAIRNNGGGHYNHSLFWKILNPEGKKTAPEGALLQAVDEQIGGVDVLMERLSTAGMSVFGSGWAWLIVNKEGLLEVTTTPNQDNPLMANLVDKSGTPVLGIDVWEHAYYLNYQNKRADYLKAVLELVNWAEVEKNYAALVSA